MPPPEKPDMISDKESPQIEYTTEELESIKEFTSFFNRAPGQVDMSELTRESEPFPQEPSDQSEELIQGREESAVGLDDKDAEAVLDDLGSLDDLVGDTPAAVDDLGSLDDLVGDAPTAVDDLGGLDDLVGDAPAAVDDLGGLDDLVGDAPKVEADSIDAQASNTDLSFPSLSDLSPSTVSFSTKPPEEGEPYIPPKITPSANSQNRAIQFDDDEIRALRENLKSYPIQIRKLAINAIIEDKLSGNEVKSLVDSVTKRANMEEVKYFLEEKLGIDLKHLADEEEQKTKVVVSDVDYTIEGLEKAAQRSKRIKYGGMAALIFAAVSFSLYWGVIKPWLYKRLVSNAKKVILSKKPNPPSLSSVDEAEELFEKARKYYPTKMYAYLQLANAYQEIRFYENTFEKLFGKVSLNEPIRLYDEYISASKTYWKKVRSVPPVSYSGEGFGQIRLGKSNWTLEKKGAYLISHLDKNDNDAIVLAALGKFHSSPAKNFNRSPYRNNLLGIDYFKRILNFKVETPLFRKDDYMAIALGGIGDVYYQQNDYYKSNEYFKKIITNQPENIIGHSGVLKNLLKLYSKQKDPRLVIDYHNKVKYSAQIEDKLPLYILSRLAAFYIDLPEQDDLRVKYNISPKDSVNAKALKSRSLELLNILYRSKRKDEYENVIDGRFFAEGYYQRGRYFKKILEQPRMAMEQFEYAYQYNPRHFLALNERAEILIDIHDYTGATENLKLAIEQLSPDRLASLGNSPDNETLLDANIAEIYFNYGKSIYLNIIQDLGDTHSWQRIQESEKYGINSNFSMESLVRELDRAEVYFEQASSIGINDLERRTELNYFQGWSAYARGNSQKALFHWDSIAPHYQLQHRNLELAKSHALYRLGVQSELRKKYLQASLGHLTFLQGYYEKRVNNVLKPSNRNKAHVKLFTRLSIIENNIGAIYEVFNDETRATKHYWNSVDYSQRVSRENEVARYNLKLSFRRTGLSSKESVPVIMDYVPPKLFEVAEN